VNHQILVFLLVLLILLYSILRGSIESTKAALPGNARKPTPRLLQSGQVVIEDRSMTQPTPATSATSLSIIDTAPNGRPVSDDQHPHTVGGGTVVVTDVNDPDDADSASSSQAFAEIYLLADDVPEDQGDNREEQMELWGAIRTMQRKIVRLADEAVAASGPSSGKTDNGGAHSATSVGTTPRETAVTLQPDGKTNSLGPQMEVSGVGQDVILLSDTLGNDFEIPYSAVRSWQVSFHPELFSLCSLAEASQAIKAFIMTEYAEVKADIHGVLILNEEAKRKAFRDAGYDDLRFASFHGFEDLTEGDVGRNEQIGSNIYRMKTPRALVAVLGSWARFLTAIDEEKFTIFYRPGPAGQRQMVLPDAWYSNVKPGWIVELLFDNNELNELKTKFPPSYRRIRCAHMAALKGVSTVGSLLARGSPSGPVAQSASPGPSLSPRPSLSPSAEGERSQKKGLPGLMRKLGV
jgi:hypothetical protein